jgi:predicted TIM-barrel fold metal-dependent hydrolase
VKLDGHIHIEEGAPDPEGLLRRLSEAGLDGGALISLPPASFRWLSPPRPYSERLQNLMAWSESRHNLLPLFWIDPMEDDAEEQVQQAIRQGVAGFKVICNRFYPEDRHALKIFRLVAQQHKPILFHSGILWDGESSSRFNRPAGFEALLEVKGLVFSLAHIGWPWTDELIAVYGKFLNALGTDAALSVEMFVDLTPGTPAIYRREALMRLFTVGYDVEHNVIFGSDCSTAKYNTEWTRQWIARDSAVYHELGLSEGAFDGVFGQNLRRFLRAQPVQHRTVRSGQ